LRFVTVAGTPPHSLSSYSATLSLAMSLPDATIEVNGTGVYTSDAFSCEWSVDILGQSSNQVVKGSPANVWIGDPNPTQLPANSPEAVNAQVLCPSSPQFWAGFREAPEGGDTEVKNDVPSRRIDMTEETGGVPGAQFSEIPGVELESASLWVAEPGGWVSAIEFVMQVGPDAATQLWGIPFDPDAAPTEMIYSVNVVGVDDPALLVELPEAIDDSIGFGEVVVDGDALPQFQSGGLDSALQTLAPTVSGADWDGNATTIAPDGRSKIVVFVAHWCPHCQDEVPQLVSWLDEGNLPEGIDVYAVSVLTDVSAPNWPPQDWLVREGLEIPTIMDDQARSIATAYGLAGVPFHVVLDGDNNVLVRVSGAMGAEGLDTLVEIADS
jgi:thiol-disulfide isomerase/thioredoxin